MEEGYADSGHVIGLSGGAQLQAVATQLDGGFGGEHTGRFHVTVGPSLLVDRGQCRDQGFGYFAAFVGGQRLGLQHVCQALLDVVHDGVDK